MKQFDNQLAKCGALLSRMLCGPPGLAEWLDSDRKEPFKPEWQEWVLSDPEKECEEIVAAFREFCRQTAIRQERAAIEAILEM